MRVICSSLILLGALAGCGALRPLGTLSADDTDPTTDGSIDTDVGVDPADCATPLVTSYADADKDVIGDNATAAETCGLVDGRVSNGGDCDDRDAQNVPGGTEICDTRDNDCDQLVDDDDDSLDTTSLLEWFMDKDLDGYGAGQPVRGCEADGNHPVADGTDCNDANPNVNPGMTEVCGAGDQDCDSLVDDDDPSVDPATQQTFFADGDGDGLGDPAAPILSCAIGPAEVTNDDDCDDNKKLVGAPETMWSDADLDGYGDGVSLGKQCPAAGTIEAGGVTDCDDGNNDRFPGNNEVCNDGVDQDCTGADKLCPIGSYDVHDGPAWNTNPPVYSCLDACALLFGGAANDYQCSTSDKFINNGGYMSGYGDPTYCTVAVVEDYKREVAGDPGYDCGFAYCSYSAYVQDNCKAANAINYCWPP